MYLIRREAKMSNPGPTKEEFDSLIYKLATLDSEFGQARKLLEAPPKKVSGWKRYWTGVIVMALVVALLLLPSVSHALTIHQKALVGLRGMHVLVEKMDPQAEHLGLTEAQIQTDVELRLRKAGIRVLTEKEWKEAPGMPYLYVHVNTLVMQKLPIIANSVHVGLKEVVTLARGFKAVGEIWRADSIGNIGPENISKIRGYVGDQVDKFINDYLAANQKK
jgi:hypothetical protein